MAFCQCFLHKDVNRNVVFLRYWMLMNIYWISIFLSIFFKRTKSTFDPSLMLRTSFCCVTLYGSVFFFHLFFLLLYYLFPMTFLFMWGLLELWYYYESWGYSGSAPSHWYVSFLFFFSICASKLTSSCVWLWTFSFNPAPQMGWEVRGSLKWGL